MNRLEMRVKNTFCTEGFLVFSYKGGIRLVYISVVLNRVLTIYICINPTVFFRAFSSCHAL